MKLSPELRRNRPSFALFEEETRRKGTTCSRARAVRIVVRDLRKMGVPRAEGWRIVTVAYNIREVYSVHGVLQMMSEGKIPRVTVSHQRSYVVYEGPGWSFREKTKTLV